MTKKLLDIRQKSIKELRTEVDKKKLELAKEFSETSSSKKREFKKMRELKLEIARIMTIIREKELSGEVESKSKPKMKKSGKIDKGVTKQK